MAHACRRLPRWRISFLAAVADPDEKRLGKVAKKYDVSATYKDYQDLVKDPNVNAVVVSLPTPLHARAALAAIEQGKHVLCEMPLAASLEEADQIIEAADKSGVILMPGLTFRFTPNYVKAKQLYDEGRLGNLSAAMYREFIPAKDLAGQWPAGSWVWNLEASGGPLYTLAVWSIDLMRWLMNTEITQVHSSCKYTKLERFGRNAWIRRVRIVTVCQRCCGLPAIQRLRNAFRLGLASGTGRRLDARHRGDGKRQSDLAERRTREDGMGREATRTGHVGPSAARRVLRQLHQGRRASDHHARRRSQGDASRSADCHRVMNQPMRKRG